LNFVASECCLRPSLEASSAPHRVYVENQQLEQKIHHVHT
jgi:hypothetical protein